MNNNEVCPISLEQIKTAFKLSCGHVFEKENIIDWLSSKKTCPLCRKDVTEEDFINISAKKIEIDHLINQYGEVSNWTNLLSMGSIFQHNGKYYKVIDETKTQFRCAEYKELIMRRKMMYNYYGFKSHKKLDIFKMYKVGTERSLNVGKKSRFKEIRTKHDTLLVTSN